MTKDIELLLKEIPLMEGWLTSERAVEQYFLIRKAQPEVVVEIGVFGGRSLLPKALAVKANGHGKVFGVDPWKKQDATEGSNGSANDEWWNSVDLEKMHLITMQSIWHHALDDVVVIIRAASHHIPKLFMGGIDVLDIDGNHSEKASCRDVASYLPQLNSKGFVLMDDCDWKSTEKAQAR